MTDRKQALVDLRDKVKTDETKHGHRWFDAFGPDIDLHALRAFNGSLDAAKALHEAVLPGWWWRVTSPDPHYVQVGMPGIGVYSGRDETPARAWLLAILEALIAQEDET